MNKYQVTLTRLRYLGKGKSEDYKETLMVQGYSEQQVRDTFSCGGYKLDGVQLYQTNISKVVDY